MTEYTDNHGNKVAVESSTDGSASIQWTAAEGWEAICLVIGPPWRPTIDWFGKFPQIEKSWWFNAAQNENFSHIDVDGVRYWFVKVSAVPVR